MGQGTATCVVAEKPHGNARSALLMRPHKVHPFNWVWWQKFTLCIPLPCPSCSPSVHASFWNATWCTSSWHTPPPIVPISCFILHIVLRQHIVTCDLLCVIIGCPSLGLGWRHPHACITAHHILHIIVTAPLACQWHVLTLRLRWEHSLPEIWVSWTWASRASFPRSFLLTVAHTCWLVRSVTSCWPTFTNHQCH